MRAVRFAAILSGALLGAALLAAPPSAAGPIATISAQPGLVQLGMPAPAVTAPTLTYPDNGARIDLRYFQWAEMRTALKYKIQLSVVSDFHEILHEVDVSGTRYVLAEPLVRRAYWWRVQAQNAEGGWGAWSEVRTVVNVWKDPDSGLEARPNRVRALQVDGQEFMPTREQRAAVACSATGPGGAVSCVDYPIAANSVLLTWDGVPGAAAYELELGTDPTFLNPGTKCEVLRNRWTPYEGGPCGSVKAGEVFVRVTAIDALKQRSTPSNLPTVDATSVVGLVLRLTLTDPVPVGSPSWSPATLGGPAAGTNFTDAPTMWWPAVPWATQYLVGLFEDDSMATTNTIPAATLAAVPKVKTANTSFVLADLLPDNNAGRAYHWFVLPCTDATTCSPHSLVLGTPGAHLSFTKVGVPLVGLSAAVIDQAWPVLTWTARSSAGDSPCAFSTSQPTLVGCPGSPQYEVVVDEVGSVTQSANQWVLSELVIVPEKTYTWRVRVVGTPAQRWAESTFRIQKRPTDVLLQVSPRAGMKVGDTVSLVATVLPVVATGKVTFIDSGHALGAAEISAGHALLETKGIYGGSQALQAIYPGSKFMAQAKSAAESIHVTDTTKPRLTSLKLTRKRSGPKVTWRAADAGGLRWAQIRTKLSGKSKGVRTVKASEGSWTAPAGRKGAKFCATVKVSDWAGNWSKSRTKCVKLK